LFNQTVHIVYINDGTKEKSCSPEVVKHRRVLIRQGR